MATTRFTWRKDKCPTGLRAVGWECNNVRLCRGDEVFAIVNFTEKNHIYWYNIHPKLDYCNTSTLGIAYSSIDEAKKACKKWVLEQIKIKQL